MNLTKADLWNLADCATRRAISSLLKGHHLRAEGDIETAESYQRRHSYTMADMPFGYSPFYSRPI